MNRSGLMLCTAALVCACAAAPVSKSDAPHAESPSRGPAVDDIEGVIDEAPASWLTPPPNLGVASLFDREASGLKPFTVTSADGRYTATLDALATPVFTLQEDGVDLEFHLAPDESVECSIHAQRLLPAHRMASMAARLSKALDLRAVWYAQVSLVGGHPLSDKISYGLWEWGAR